MGRARSTALINHATQAPVTHGLFLLIFLVLALVWFATHRHLHYWPGGTLISWLVPTFQIATLLGLINNIVAHL
jgi:hypothetical protein